MNRARDKSAQEHGRCEASPASPEAAREVMLRDLRSVIAWLPARARWSWLLLLPLAASVALVEAAGALAVFGLLRLVVDPQQVRTAPVISQLFRTAALTDPRAVEIGRASCRERV